MSGLGLDDLEGYFRGHRTAALLGSSGVGKSTLINRLIGRDVQRVQEVRDDGKGRHTTTHRELIVRPGGGLVLDTPGLHELQLSDDAEGIAPAFAEVEDLAASCCFVDCAHESEPGCAVLAAVADGRLPLDRLDGYRKLLGEVRHFEARHDARARADRKRQEKVMSRSPCHTGDSIAIGTERDAPLGEEAAADAAGALRAIPGHVDATRIRSSAAVAIRTGGADSARRRVN